MHDIFLSYANADLPRVLPLVRALERHGWSVWWDRRILPGRALDHVIEEALEEARCVVVVWSSLSVNADWVRAEAEEGRQRGILVPVCLDEDARIPLVFRRLLAARLHDWQATDPHLEFDRLVQAVTALLGPPPQQQEARPPVVEYPVTPQQQERTQDPERYVNSLGMEFVWISAGEFLMGSTDGDDDERPVHRVRISRPFYLGKYAVTQGEWEAIMGSNPSRFRDGPRQPVEQVSWEDAQEFIRKLNAQEKGAQYRLPTEAEWEYAARAGTTTAYCFGDDASQLRAYAWYGDNSDKRTHPVGQLQPNAWGLYDMHGNVWEWVQDWYGAYTAEPAVDPQGPSSGSVRVIRGGGWFDYARNCRSAFRSYADPGYRNDLLGLRLLRTAQ
jgi:formylglycine-generating enzyme required for sulfatase activity